MNETSLAAPRKRRVVDDGAPVAPRALLPTMLGAFAVAIALVFAVRGVAVGMFEVPDDEPTLINSALILSTVFPVGGNAFGFFMSYRRPQRLSLLLFLGVGAIMTVAGTAISMTKLSTSADSGSVITTLLVSIIPVLVVVPALLRLRGNDAARWISSSPGSDSSP
jgi:peptidoglycan/LPS O-acetylase OafA/YrhL